MQDETTSESPQYPVEYQVFALSLRNPGSIEFFDVNLPEEIVGLPTNQVGINEFYKALLAYHHATKLDIVNPVTFKSWLESETDVYSGLGGSVGVDTMIDILLNLEVSDHESITQLIKHRANKHKQLSILQELEFILTQKGEKTPKELARIAEITTEIKNLEVELNYNPLDSVSTANDILELDISNVVG